jgi:broad specificity phosphatase PhoE
VLLCCYLLLLYVRKMSSASTPVSSRRPRQARTDRPPLPKHVPAPASSSSSSLASGYHPTPSPFTVSPFEIASKQKSLHLSSSIITPRRLEPASTVGVSSPDDDDDRGTKTTTTTTTKKSRIIYLIRHGQSQGQVASNRHDRSLRDCGLTATGQEQARTIPAQFDNPADYDSIDWVICSPLTRAIETAVLAFPNRTITCHYDLFEIGSTRIPENIPRRTAAVWAHLEQQQLVTHTNGTTKQHLDLVSLRPEGWPKQYDKSPTVLRKNHIRNVFLWIAQTVPDSVRGIAVVCHFHVIRAALQDPRCRHPANANFVNKHVHPANAELIRCELLVPSGQLRLLLPPSDTLMDWHPT